MCIYVCIYIYMCVCVNRNVYILIYIYIYHSHKIVIPSHQFPKPMLMFHMAPGPALTSSVVLKSNHLRCGGWQSEEMPGRHGNSDANLCKSTPGLEELRDSSTLSLQPSLGQKDEIYKLYMIGWPHIATLTCEFQPGNSRTHPREVAEGCWWRIDLTIPKSFNRRSGIWMTLGPRIRLNYTWHLDWEFDSSNLFKRESLSSDRSDPLSLGKHGHGSLRSGFVGCWVFGTCQIKGNTKRFL